MSNRDNDDIPLFDKCQAVKNNDEPAPYVDYADAFDPEDDDISRDAAYDIGYQAGFEDGYQEGLQEGYDDGYADGECGA